MNLGDLDVQVVHHNRPQLQRIDTADLPITPQNLRLHDFRTPSLTSTISDAETVIKWQTPPSRIRTPERSKKDNSRSRPIGANEAAYASNAPLVVRFDEEQIRDNEAEASTREKMDYDPDEPPTPGTDDTPYIRFALEQLTRDQDVKAATGRPITDDSSSDSYPVERVVPDLGLGYYSGTRLTREELALARKHRSSPEPEPMFRFNATRPLSYPPNLNDGFMGQQQQPSSSPEIFIPVDAPVRPRFPGLTFVPMILRPFSMITLSLLCLLMIAAIMFCAIYSTYHNGLAEWFSGIYGGRYFVFGFLPQILGAFIFIYVQCVMSAVARILPYTLMAMDDTRLRTNALFLGIYPKSMFWPRWDGPMSVDISRSFFWLAIFTIPLQGCLFSVIPGPEGWRWTAVQGIAWTLVALYVLILIAAVILGLFFFQRTTGLIWDPRSLADIIAVLPRSNSLDYMGTTEIMRNKKEIEHRVGVRSDRLGYWRTQNRTQGIFYCLGEEGTATRRYTLEAGKLHQKSSNPDLDQSSDVEKSAGLYSRTTRFRHIPWQLRDTFVIFWSVAAFILLLALIIISFLPSTAIRNGFPPLINALPNAQGFSPANFLYSFVPSALGMFLYLLFQPLDMALRKLQPWAELGDVDGSTANNSLLLDYTAEFPIVCTLKAFARAHYRVALVSLLSFLFILIPVLAGGLFFPLTTPNNEVRMIPNLSSFYILLTLLILYLIGLLILIPNRYQMHLPHSVDCLAEIISFVYNSGMLTDAAFRAPQTKLDLVTRLTALSARGQEHRYAFGVFRGRDGKESLGIERVGRRGSQDVMILSASDRRAEEL